MSKPANLKTGSIKAGKKLTATQAAALKKSSKNINIMREGIGWIAPYSPKKAVAAVKYGPKLVNKTIKTLRSK